MILSYILEVKVSNKLVLKATLSDDAQWIKDLCDKNWGGEPLVVRGKKFHPTALPGLIAESENKIIGALFYEIRAHDCEIIMVEVFDKFNGIGTQLLNELINIAKSKNCNRIYLMTTNDNLDALRFYQRRGFTICGIHIDSVKESRKLKPTIGMIGDHDIPLRDEIDLQLII